jgi:hypothetical protein
VRMFRLRLPAALPAAIAVALAACSDSTQPTDPAASPDNPDLRASGSQQPAGPLALGKTVRGFGGFFLDAQGAPTVYLTDASQRATAARALEPWLRANGTSAAALQVRKGEFAWTDLERWFAKASPAAFGIRGTIYVDADEAANRIHVAVERGTSADQIRAALVQAGIPAEAVLVTESPPIRALATLRDAVRPTVGGLQINFDPDPASPGSFVCTLGFNAIAGGQRSFITNSHCSNQQGGTEGTVYGQPLLSGGVIATEVDDPNYVRGRDCYASFVCRYSDALRAAYAAGTTSSLGTIARTPGPNNTGSQQLTLAGDFTITGEDLSTEFVVGSVLNKVGRTSGWTQGPVSLTCIDVLQSGSRFVKLCQTLVEANSLGGDSGSPVFAAAEGSNNVTLAGILWGGAETSSCSAR